MDKFPKIVEATVKKPYIIEVKFDNNHIKYYDFNKLLNDDNFSKLKDYNFFKNLVVSVGGYGIEWDDELDLSEAELWLNGHNVN